MKKLILLGTAILSNTLVAEIDRQPLHLSRVTILPDGCEGVANSTATIEITASGGQPGVDGLYTYHFNNETKVARTAIFTEVPIDTLNFLISDSLAQTTSGDIDISPSRTGSITMSVDSLPLGNTRGCITLSVTNPGGIPGQLPSVNFSVSNLTEIGSIKKSSAPFSATFSVLSNDSFQATTIIANDCGVVNQNGGFNISFSLPKASGNNLKEYFYNNYCSCTLNPNTIPVNPDTTGIN